MAAFSNNQSICSVLLRCWLMKSKCNFLTRAPQPLLSIVQAGEGLQTLGFENVLLGIRRAKCMGRWSDRPCGQLAAMHSAKRSSWSHACQFTYTRSSLERARPPSKVWCCWCSSNNPWRSRTCCLNTSESKLSRLPVYAPDVLHHLSTSCSTKLKSPNNTDST